MLERGGDRWLAYLLVAASLAWALAGPAQAADPTARFTVEVEHGTVHLDASASGADGNATIESYTWSLGDGNTSTGRTTSHTYADSGTYTIELTVEDDQERQATNRTDVTVEVNEAPIPRPHISVDGATVYADGSNSSDPDGQIEAHHWSWGDGNETGGTRANHTYAESGTYLVQLLVWDDNGTRALTGEHVNVTVPNRAPKASFVADTTDRRVIVDAQNTVDPDGDELVYRWAFGDGATGSGVVTDHTYETEGTYTIRLTVEDGQGARDNATREITAEPSNHPPRPEATITCEAMECQADASGTVDPDREDLTYTWHWGDGGQANGIEATHAYEEPGEHEIRLVVADEHGATASLARTVTVEEGSAGTSSPGVRQTAGNETNGTAEDGDDATVEGSQEAGGMGSEEIAITTLVGLTVVAVAAGAFLRWDPGSTGTSYTGPSTSGGGTYTSPGPSSADRSDGDAAELEEIPGLTLVDRKRLAREGIQTAQDIRQVAAERLASLTTLDEPEARALKADVDLKAVHGIGSGRAARLRAAGVHTISQLREADAGDLSARTGIAEATLTKLQTRAIFHRNGRDDAAATNLSLGPEDPPVDALTAIVAAEPREVWTNRVRCQGVLRDRCVGYNEEIASLACPIEAEVVEPLARAVEEDDHRAFDRHLETLEASMDGDGARASAVLKAWIRALRGRDGEGTS